MPLSDKLRKVFLDSVMKQISDLYEVHVDDVAVKAKQFNSMDEKFKFSFSVHMNYNGRSLSFSTDMKIPGVGTKDSTKNTVIDFEQEKLFK